MILRNLSISVALVLVFGGCQPMRNFTTYFNLFYNMERNMDEVEEELLYIREQKLAAPVFYVPYDDVEQRGTLFYDHLERRTMSNDEMRANKNKLDSLVQRGSKLLAFKGKSDYVDDAVYYLGKTFFYMREWYQSQRKCEELIANFPESKWLPDAHLLYSMDLMHLGNRNAAETMLSRTIDIAWGRRRLDVLVEAFRLNADIYIAENNLAKAMRPYERAMLLSSDGADLARWKYEMGLLQFRMGEFEMALRSFDSVDEFTPDVLIDFQTGMQRAATLRVLKRYNEAAEQLDDLADNNNYEPWWGMVAMEQLNLSSATGSTPASDSALLAIDSMSPGKSYSSYIVYERGVNALRSGDYKTALTNFGKAQTSVAPFQRRARQYAVLLTQYFDQTGKAKTIASTYTPEGFPDSTRVTVANAYYATARVFVALDIPDSITAYYALSEHWAPKGSAPAARVIYARAMQALDNQRKNESDSLLRILVEDASYGLTEYADDARRRLGYTEYQVIDPAYDNYIAGRKNMDVGENTRALTLFGRVADSFPQSPYAPQALYAMGLLYEGPLANRDSAYTYYYRLVSLYPATAQADDARKLIEAFNMWRMQQPHNGGDTSVPQRNDGMLPLDAGTQPQALDPRTNPEERRIPPNDPRQPQQMERKP